MSNPNLKIQDQSYSPNTKYTKDNIYNSDTKSIPQINWNAAYIDSQFNINNVQIIDKQIVKLKQQLKKQQNSMSKMQNIKSATSHKTRQKPQNIIKSIDNKRVQSYHQSNKPIQQYKSHHQLDDQLQQYKIKSDQNQCQSSNWITSSSPDFIAKDFNSTHKYNTDKKSYKKKTQPQYQTTIYNPQYKKPSYKQFYQHKLHFKSNQMSKDQQDEFNNQYQPDMNEQVKNTLIPSLKIQPFSVFIKKHEKKQLNKNNQRYFKRYQKKTKSYQYSFIKKKTAFYSKYQIQKLNNKIAHMQNKLDNLQKKQTYLEKIQLPKFSNKNNNTIQNNHTNNQVNTNDMLQSKYSQQIIPNLPVIYDSKIYKKSFFGSQTSQNKNTKGKSIQKIILQQKTMNKKQMAQQINKLKQIIKQLQIQKVNQQKIINQLQTKNHADNAKNIEGSNQQVQCQQSISKVQAINKNIQNAIKVDLSTQTVPKLQQIYPIKIDQQSNLVFNQNFHFIPQHQKSQTKSQQQIKYLESNSNENKRNNQIYSSSLKKRGIIARQVIPKQNDQHNQIQKQQKISSIPTNFIFDFPSPTYSGKKIFQIQFIKQCNQIQQNLYNLKQRVNSIQLLHLKIPNIPQKPSYQTSQHDLLYKIKQLCEVFQMNIKSYKNVIIRKYNNCVIFQIPSTNQTVVWHYSGKLYIGDWQQNQQGQGKKIGNGRQYKPGKYYYEGQFLSGRRNGSGIMILINGNVYKGQWENGQKHGHGCYSEQKLGIVYEGQWKQDKKQGKGILKLSQNQFYEGLFMKSIKHGYGCEFFVNGDFYQGQYKQGKFHGNGKYLWKTGAMYDGQFTNGSRNGIGKWKSNKTQFDLFVGEYKNDQKSGKGKYIWHNGSIYDGCFNNDLKNGQGRILYPEGREVRGFWQKGKLAKIYAVIDQNKIQINQKHHSYQNITTGQR